MTTFLISLLFFNEILITEDSSSFVFWIVVLMSLFCAITVGYFAMIIPKYGIIINLGFFILGATFGITIAFILDNLIYSNIE